MAILLFSLLCSHSTRGL